MYPYTYLYKVCLAVQITKDDVEDVQVIGWMPACWAVAIASNYSINEFLGHRRVRRRVNERVALKCKNSTSCRSRRINQSFECWRWCGQHSLVA